MKRQGWIAAALGLSLAGTAYAQETHEHGAGQESGTKTEPSEQSDTKALGKQAKGEMQEQASERLSRMEADGVQLSSLDEDQVKDVQRSLQEAGYYEGTIDGIAGGATKQALSTFYRDQAQLASRGMITPQAAAAVGLEEADVQPVSGTESEEGEEGQAEPREKQQMKQPQQQGEQPKPQQQEQPQQEQQPPRQQQEQPSPSAPQQEPQEPQEPQAPHEPIP